MRDHTDISEDVGLLRSKPDQLILKYKGTVRVIVKKYVALGMFRPSDYEDTVQSVFESLFRKIPAMQRQYNGSVLFVTYFSSIIRNICLALRNSASRRVQTTELHDMASSDPEPIHDSKLIEETVNRFRTILLLYDQKLPRVLLGLKLWYRLPISAGDLQSWYPDASTKDRAAILRSFGTYYEHMRDPELYRRVTPILNRLENKSNQPDSLRRSIASTIREILALLNGTPARYGFTEESLSVLVEDYFFRI